MKYYFQVMCESASLKHFLINAHNKLL